MSKIKLIDLINALIEMRDDYKDETGKEPQIWDFEMSCGDFESVELTHGVRRKGGLTTAVNGTRYYALNLS